MGGTMASPGQIMRDLINAPEILIMPGVYDGFSVRLVERMGFKAAGISGAGLSETNLGWADLGIMGYEENLHASAAAAPATARPLRARPLALDPAAGRRRHRLRQRRQRLLHGAGLRARGHRRADDRGPGL